jgi:hypothetical protein
MGISLSEVPYIKLAEQWGAGSTEIKEEDIIRLNNPDYTTSYPEPTAQVKLLMAKVNEDSACSACYAGLVRALHTCGGTHKTPIAIGQGWKGKEFNGIGIGRCCDGARTQVKGCPPTAEDIAFAILNN